MAVTALRNCGKSYSQIFELLKPLKISRMFIYRAIKRYEELWRVEGRAQSGRLKSLRAQDDIKTMRQRIRRNPLWKQKIMSRLNISIQSMSRLIRNDQHMILHCRSKGHILTAPLKTIRRRRAERPFHWHADKGHDNILFTDGKICTFEEHTTTRTTRFMLKRPLRCILMVQGGHHRPTSWFGESCPIRG